MSKRSATYLVLFLSALAVKGSIFLFAADPIVFNKYPYFAEQLCKGLDIGERTLDLSPLYLYVNVLFYKIWGANWGGLAVLQILVGSLSCLLTFAIGARLFDRNVGLAATVLLLLYGNLTLIELTLEPEVFVIFFNGLAVLALIEAGSASSSGPPLGKWLLAGVLIGLSVITKANGLLLVPGAVAWIWWGAFRRDRRMAATLLLLLGVSLLVVPVTLRNYLKFHDPVLVTADGGKVFFHGNGPSATGIERADLANQAFIEEGQSEPDYAHVLFRNTARALSGSPLKPSECSNFWVQKTLEHMRAHSGDAFFLELKKFGFFWSNYEVHDLDSTYRNYVTLQGWPLIAFGIIASLGIVGMGLALKRFRRTFLLYWLVLAYLLSVLLFFAASRYRLPAVPFLAIFAAHALLTLLRLARQRSWKPLLIGLGASAILAAGSNLLFSEEIRRFDRWQAATRIHYSLEGRMLFKKGLYREAVAGFRRSVALEPGFMPAYDYLGKSLAMLGDYEQAERNFLKVVELAPGVDEGYMNLGFLYELMGQRAKAASWLGKALALNPGNERVKRHLEVLGDLPRPAAK